MKTRTEKDFIGSREIPENALYGIHSLRAGENFPKTEEKHDPEFIRAYSLVKKACIRAAGEAGLLDQEKSSILVTAIDHLLNHSETLEASIIVPPLQGGAGTSLNMNLNEVIVNQGLLLMDKKPGEYDFLHPNDHANCCQSTNDTYPTALKIAVIWRFRELTETVCRLQEVLQAKEKEFSSVVKIGRTQMQDALPMTLGAEFGAWAEAFARDRWRFYKAEERLRVANLGGTAIGTGVNATRRYTFLALQHLRSLSGVGIAKAENLLEATSNQDLFLEAFGWVKVFASNLYKIAQDLRFLSSSAVGEVILPSVQSGSSIMPGKVNPVIPELVIEAVFEVMGADAVVTRAAMEGDLELNAWLPVLGKHFLSSLRILNGVVELFIEKCLSGISCNEERCYGNLIRSHSLLTALNPVLGYEKVTELVKEGIEKGKELGELIREKGILTEDQAKQYLSPERMIRKRE
jgi:aspartate ammonia-lyase